MNKRNRLMADKWMLFWKVLGSPAWCAFSLIPKECCRRCSDDSDNGCEDIYQLLERLHKYNFHLPVDLAVRPFHQMKDAFWKIFLTHAAFSISLKDYALIYQIERIISCLYFSINLYQIWVLWSFHFNVSSIVFLHLALYPHSYGFFSLYIFVSFGILNFLF